VVYVIKPLKDKQLFIKQTIRIMKNLIILLALFFSALTIQAQNDSTQNPSENLQSGTPSENAQPASTEITDAELEKYAVTMDSVNDMKQSLLDEITNMVKSNEKMTNARYNELSKILDDEAQLAKAKATPEEVAFMKAVAAKKEQGTARIQETFQTMAKDYVGASSFNKIKDALDADPEVQKRYQEQLTKVSSGGGN
jgi:alpha-glucosidase (family GH31 glycosyl hydrolase)